MYGIDAPEKKQPYGKKSTEFLASLIAGKKVEVETHGKDKYRRTLGIVFYNKEDINAKMVKNGFAWAYLRKKYVRLEYEARSKKVGLWQDDNPTPPYAFRKFKR